MIFRFPIFGGMPGRGVISRMKALLDSHSTVLDNVEGEDGISVRKNWKGGLTIGGQTSGSALSEYTSYFKVVDASTPGTCKIGVTDGGHGGTPEHCGTVYLNGVAILIDVFDKTVASAGMYWVWLHSWISAASGEQAEIIVGAVDVEDSPDNPNGGVAFASQLLGRVTVAGGAITAINQDYLRGGEHVVYLWGDCDGFEQS